MKQLETWRNDLLLFRSLYPRDDCCSACLWHVLGSLLTWSLAMSCATDVDETEWSADSRWSTAVGHDGGIYSPLVAAKRFWEVGLWLARDTGWRMIWRSASQLQDWWRLDDDVEQIRLMMTLITLRYDWDDGNDIAYPRIDAPRCLLKVTRKLNCVASQTGATLNGESRR